MPAEEKFDKENDKEYWSDGLVTSKSYLTQGSLIVVMNNVVHKGAIRVENSEKVVKLVCKISVN